MKIYLLTPLSRNTGTKTTAVVTVAAKTGSATSVPPSPAAFSGEAPSSMKRKMFSSTITELSIKRDSTSASPPNNIVLIDPPMPLMIKRQVSTASGMATNAATVALALPRKIRIMTPVRRRPIPASSSRFPMAPLTNKDWSKTTAVRSVEGISTSFVTAARMPSTMVMVLLLPACFSTGIYTERCPFMRTMFV